MLLIVMWYMFTNEFFIFSDEIIILNLTAAGKKTLTEQLANPLGTSANKDFVKLRA